MMRSIRRQLAASLAALLCATTVSAQVVRGTVTERGSARPLAGALVSLQQVAPGSVLRQAVTNQRGEYAVQAPGAGQYQLVVRRIGVAAYQSAPFALTIGETRAHDVVLDPFTTLPPVTVTDRTLCTTRRDGGRIASLWVETRTALNVIVISSEDSIVQRRLVRYRRTLTPYSLEVKSEESHSYDARDGLDPAFASLSGAALSERGYWVDDENAAVFYAPDANALLSSAFLRDHCFGLVQGGSARPGLTGLSFQPVRGRTTPDIRGTMWLDSRTYELREVEFRWTGLPRELAHDSIGGEVHFARLPDGHWIVKRWVLRMPRTKLVLRRGAGVVRDPLLQLDGIGVEGGMILVQGASQLDEPGSVTGTVVRSNGKPLAGARVRLVGSAFSTVADARGRFALDGVPPGQYAIIAEHADFDVFGVRAAEQEIFLEEAGIRRVTLNALGEKELVDKLCPTRDWHLPTLRVTLVHEQTRAPLRNVRLRLRYFKLVTVFRGGRPSQAAEGVDQDVVTNDRGVAMFCDLPATQALELGFAVDSTGLYPLHTFKLGTQQNQVATVRAAPP